MITIICGDDIVKSREALVNLKKVYKEKSYELIDIDSNSVDDLRKNILERASLFSQKRLFFIHGVLSKKGNRDVVHQLDTQDNPILIWEDKYSDKDIKKNFPKAKVLVFKLPQTIWKLLDNIYPRNLHTVILLTRSIIDSVDENMLLYMLQKRTKELILVKSNSKHIVKLAPWQITKLSSQTKKWDMNKLYKFYQKLFEIEKGTKSGSLPYSIYDALDILFCFYLQ
ncbi:hypothetical protein A3H80_03455 [Candidatus Roizmanbacteria bacterium RIFCSPLOWO2_02_FULL_37_19]|uniref:DNA polymerase III delta N-terminal domain-containing protein n=1 Tax=Candidatus Roizmanbacteria bacterium RIFCSPHIGHO2_02_FULL_37_24 TaxID=1802037 RepID=A0A1F7GX58_9BACT|nr:MAG: hypothetical protein A2862_03465 [Candidatus Roizmanbacteria bacterium RIFCSPHIGHO2_01_FULL_38_41]OGK23072.1 MAG: hypothetical protein A3C24_01570 [Candidatus Roizmanbacteria bacterium RIFCSPHIGHO2_02_FULL_37_24]OGK54684.1 MAG: hypothetical protein A3H80_03455 [Candidatus Roizmanbacteria bacterium RIFCSPLOWO2_02_FULL_37_19]OGK61731.1 MAG: hypothetical protein A3G65_02315 [Candidatus Roizmanbacteria bacterium RIFCSPLOWO2_12_FULL_37_7b]